MDKKQLIYGCMGLGGDWNTDSLTKDDLITAEKAIAVALESGINYFDHADIYKTGKSEKVFGRILKNTPSLRDKIILQSKAGIRYRELGKSSIYDLSKKYLLKQVESILKRLETEYLDVFLLHRPDPLMNPEEIADAFRILKKEGKVKKFGVSNMSLHQIQFIQKLCDDPLVTNQIQLSLGHPLLLETGILVDRINRLDFNGVEGLLEFSQLHNMSIQAYSPLDGGRFTNDNLNTDALTRALVDELAKKYSTTKEAIVLAWLFKIPGTVQPVIGTTNPNRIKACSKAIDIELSRKDWYNLWITARGDKIP